MNYDNTDIANTAFIGDVHGCHGLLLELLENLRKQGVEKYVFLGDLVDRGPQPFEVVETVHKLILEGKARAVVGNHDWKFIRLFNGKDPHLGEDQNNTLDAVGKHRMDTFKRLYMDIFKDMTMFLLDEKNKVIISHAIAMRPAKIYNLISDDGNTLKKWFWTGFMYGKSDNELDARGYPRRLPITYHEYDNLDGWKSIVGHYHANNLYLEKGNPNVMCVDFCASEGGKLAALVFKEDLTPQLVFSDSSL